MKKINGNETHYTEEQNNTISEIAKNTGISEKKLFALFENDDFLKLMMSAFEKRAFLLFANMGEKHRQLISSINSQDDPRQKALMIQALKLSFEMDKFLIERGSPMFSPKQQIYTSFEMSPAEARQKAWEAFQAAKEKYGDEQYTSIEKNDLNLAKN